MVGYLLDQLIEIRICAHLLSSKCLCYWFDAGKYSLFCLKSLACVFHYDQPFVGITKTVTNLCVIVHLVSKNERCRRSVEFHHFIHLQRSLSLNRRPRSEMHTGKKAGQADKHDDNHYQHSVSSHGFPLLVFKSAKRELPGNCRVTPERPKKAEI